MKAILSNEKFLRLVNPIANKTLRKCEEILKPAKNYAVAIGPTLDSFVIKKMDGSTGYTEDKQRMAIALSTRPKNWRKGLESTLAHEFNHIIRLQYLNKNNFYNDKLIDSIASEGLAQVFEEEVTGKRPPYASAISKKVAKQLWAKIRTYKEDDYFSRFFVNLSDKKYPHWCGYTIAYLIIKRRRKEIGFSWKKLMNMPSKKLVDAGL